MYTHLCSFDHFLANTNGEWCLRKGQRKGKEEKDAFMYTHLCSFDNFLANTNGEWCLPFFFSLSCQHLSTR